MVYISVVGTALGPGWDAMQVRATAEDGDKNHFLIARDSTGKILRKVDSFQEVWEAITDAEDLKFYQRCFDDRNRLAAERENCDECKRLDAAFIRPRDERQKLIFGGRLTADDEKRLDGEEYTARENLKDHQATHSELKTSA